MIFYWLGNISVGLSVVIDMIRSPQSAWTRMIDPRGSETTMPLSGDQVRTLSVVYRIFLTPFFCLHYGLFTLGHGIFVFMIVRGELFGGDGIKNLPPINFKDIFLVWLVGVVIHLVVKLFTSAPQTISIGRLWGGAYGRIIALHISIIVGGFLITYLHLPAFAAILLIAFNFVIQLVQLKYDSVPVTMGMKSA